MKKILSILVLFLIVSLIYAGNIPKCNAKIKPLTMLEQNLNYAKQYFNVVEKKVNKEMGTAMCIYEGKYLVGFNYFLEKPIIFGISMSIKTTQEEYYSLVNQLVGKGAKIKKTTKIGMWLFIGNYPTYVSYDRGILVITRYSSALKETLLK